MNPLIYKFKESSWFHGIAICFMWGCFLVACATIVPTHFEPSEIRHINTLIAHDGTFKREQIDNLVEGFNEDAITETGIQLRVADFILFDMDKQQEIWPACKDILPCFADYVYLNKYQYDIAIYFIDNTPAEVVVRLLFGGWVGQIDDIKNRYIVLKGLSYWNFKHHVYHVFHPEHGMGVMLGQSSFFIFPLSSSGLSGASQEEILKNKWREFK